MNATAVWPSGEESGRYRELFIGTHPEEKAWAAILTPIATFYERIFSLTEAESLKGGWWSCARVKLGGLAAAWVVKVPQGSAAADFLLASRGAVRKVLWLGFCGALKRDLPLGVVTRLASDGASSLSSAWPVEFPAVRLRSVPGFLSRSPEELLQYRLDGFDAVDMETEWLIHAAQKTGIELQALYVVTDRPLDRPIISRSDAELAAISRSCLEVAERAARWLLYFRNDLAVIDYSVPR